MKEGRRQGFPFPKPVERYTPKRPTSEAGRLSPNLPQRLAEQQPHDGGLNAPKLQPPKGEQQPKLSRRERWRNALREKELEDLKMMQASPDYRVEAIENPELPHLWEDYKQTLIELVKPDVYSAIEAFLARKRGIKPPPRMETLEEQIERPRLQAKAEALRQQLEDELRAEGKLPATGLTETEYYDFKRGEDGTVFFVRRVKPLEYTPPKVDTPPFGGKDYPDVR